MRMSRRTGGVGLMAALALVTGVGYAATTIGHATSHLTSAKRDAGHNRVHPRTTAGGLGPVDWSKPFVDQTTEPSLTSARSLLAFVPLAPSLPPAPTQVVITSPASAVDVSQRAVALIYDDAALGGRFWVIEHPARFTTTAVLSEIAAACTPQVGCEAQEQMIALANGQQALQMVGNTAGVIWVQGGVYYDVVGPSPSFTAQDAVTVANAIPSTGSTAS